MTEPGIQESPWYASAFEDLYPLLYGHRDDESAEAEVAALIRHYSLSSTRVRVLDVCCGGGRHAAAFARAGFRAWGIDLSMRRLREANQRPELRGRVARSEIRSLPFAASFDLVLNLFTSFGYFQKDEENARAMREMARVLRPGGRLVVDHMNREAVERGLVPENQQSLEGFRVRQRRWIDKNRIRKKIDVADRYGRRIALHEDVRLYSPEEIAHLMTAAGLSDIRLFGSFSDDPLTAQSERMIATGVKAKETAR